LQSNQRDTPENDRNPDTSDLSINGPLNTTWHDWARKLLPLAQSRERKGNPAFHLLGKTSFREAFFRALRDLSVSKVVLG
jgi:hypothetical protein